jgi:hypothetical protein
LQYQRAVLDPDGNRIESSVALPGAQPHTTANPPSGAFRLSRERHETLTGTP